MHQPHADRKSSPISLSLTNGDPCPDFRSGKGGREIENQGGSRSTHRQKQRSLRLSHTASSMNMSHCPVTSHCPKTAKPSLALRRTTTSANYHLPKHDTANTCLPATRNLTHTHTHIHRHKTICSNKNSIGSLFSPLRFPPVRPAANPSTLAKQTSVASLHNQANHFPCRQSHSTIQCVPGTDHGDAAQFVFLSPRLDGTKQVGAHESTPLGGGAGTCCEIQDRHTPSAVDHNGDPRPTLHSAATVQCVLVTILVYSIR